MTPAPCSCTSCSFGHLSQRNPLATAASQSWSVNSSILTMATLRNSSSAGSWRKSKGCSRRRQGCAPSPSTTARRPTSAECTASSPSTRQWARKSAGRISTGTTRYVVRVMARYTSGSTRCSVARLHAYVTWRNPVTTATGRSNPAKFSTGPMYNPSSRTTPSSTPSSISMGARLCSACQTSVATPCAPGRSTAI